MQNAAQPKAEVLIENLRHLGLYLSCPVWGHMAILLTLWPSEDTLLFSAPFLAVSPQMRDSGEQERKLNLEKKRFKKQSEQRI